MDFAIPHLQTTPFIPERGAFCCPGGECGATPAPPPPYATCKQCTSCHGWDFSIFCYDEIYTFKKPSGDPMKVLIGRVFRRDLGLESFHLFSRSANFQTRRRHGAHCIPEGQLVAGGTWKPRGLGDSGGGDGGVTLPSQHLAATPQQQHRHHRITASPPSPPSPQHQTYRSPSSRPSSHSQRHITHHIISNLIRIE